MLVRIQGQLVLFHGETVAWAQNLQATTADCLNEAHRVRHGMPTSGSLFQTRTPASTLDQAKSNKRWRRFGARQGDGTGELSFEQDCIIHLDFNNITKVCGRCHDSKE